MTSRPIDATDRLEIAELLNRYGNIIDDREFSRIGEVFTEDARYDVTDFGFGVLIGTAAIVDAWTRIPNHPLAHHVTNIEISDPGHETVRALSKIIGIGPKGRVGSATYRDVLLHTPDGWRISERVVTLRHAGNTPEIS